MRSHHFNRSQQDVLLPDVEEGRVILIGTTTHNPFFAINGPLLSRSSDLHLPAAGPRRTSSTLLRRALADKERGLGDVPVRDDEEALDFLAEISDGDARRALTALEVGRAVHRRAAGRLHARAGARSRSSARRSTTTRTGDEHYDVASAFIKSMRGSDPDAAIYWLARMLEAGEDPRFIARRLVILRLGGRGQRRPAGAAGRGGGDAGGRVRRPAGVPAQPGPGGDVPGDGAEVQRLDLAISKAREDVRRAARCRCRCTCATRHYKGAEQLGHGEGYEYSHDHPGGWVRAGLPAGGAPLLRAGGPRARGRHPPADGGAAPARRRGLSRVAAPWSRTEGRAAIPPCRRPAKLPFFSLPSTLPHRATPPIRHSLSRPPQTRIIVIFF